MTEEPLRSATEELLSSYLEERDLLIFSGRIWEETVEEFLDKLDETPEENRKGEVSLFLTTHGGDAHAAYRMAKGVQKRYEKLRLLVVGPCKSAGTLVAIAADTVVFGDRGEIGPLDVQVTKPDELIPLNSGLNDFQAFAIVNGWAYKNFEQFMLDIVRGSGGNISTTTACEIASQLVTGLLNPVMAQIDPYRLGEVQRKMSISKEYGGRLGRNLQPDALERLIDSYPAHEFVIDRDEATDLFEGVEGLSREERLFAIAFDNELKKPNPKGYIEDVGQLWRGKEVGEDETADGGTQGAGEDDEGEQGESGSGSAA